jgi:ribosomal protein L37E
VKLAKCPKCGKNTLDFNALVIYCITCGFQIEDKNPLPDTREERRRLDRRTAKRWRS